MYSKTKILVRLLSFIGPALLLFGVVASAEQPVQAPAPGGPFYFSDQGSVVIKADKPGSIQVVSNTPKPLTLTFDLIDAPGNTAPLWDALQVKANDAELKREAGGAGGNAESKQGASRLLPPGNIIRITLTPKANLAPGPYNGELVVYESSSNTIIRKKLRIDTGTANAAEAAQSPEPLKLLSKTWTVYAYKFLGGMSYKNDSLPLAPGNKPENVKAYDGKVVGYLLSENGDTAAVKVNTRGAQFDGNITNIKLEFDSLDHAGKYEGKIRKDINSDPADTDPTLTVVVAHHVFWPILALLVGLLLAFFFNKYYMEVYRPVLELEERTAQLEVSFNKAKRKFKEDAEGLYPGYDISGDLKGAVAQLEIRIHNLKNAGAKLDQNNPQYQAVVTTLTDLEAQVAAWSTLAEKLNDLKAEQERVAGKLAPWSNPPLYPMPDRPALLAKSERLISASVDTLAELKPLPQEIDKTAGLLSKWPAHNAVAQDFWTTLDALGDANVLKDLTDEEKMQLSTGRSSLFALIYTLWKEADYKEEDIESGLKEVDKTLSRLRRHLPPAHPAAKMSMVAGIIGHISDAARRAASRAAATTAESRRDSFRLRITLLDLVSFVISLIIALYTYLNTNYFGHPFGTTWRNYMDAVLWGFGTQTAVTILTAALPLLGNSRPSLRLK